MTGFISFNTDAYYIFLGHAWVLHKWFYHFEFLDLEYGKIDIKSDQEQMKKIIEKVQQVTEIVTSQSLSRERMMSVINNFIIFEFLGFEYGKIDTKIESVIFVLEEIR